MDVTATGAFPILLSVTLGVEKEPTGNQIIEGIKREASQPFDIDNDLGLENIFFQKVDKVCATGENSVLSAVG